MTPLPLRDEMPDHQLLQQVAAGDQHAFVTLFRRRHPEVYRFALHMTLSAATAEDVTQEVFLAVMRDAGRYDPSRATAMAWLCGIARNFVKRRLDSDRALQPMGDTHDIREAVDPAAAGDPLDDLTRAERLSTLRRAIMSLPVRYREVVVLCDLQELNYADAATALGCAVGTVRSRLHRGRALLASKLRASDERPGLKLGKTGCFA
jgi:RNA polymerase sigma-70 factor (ECF subfamily)